jgi:hypothetical protein
MSNNTSYTECGITQNSGDNCDPDYQLRCYNNSCIMSGNTALSGCTDLGMTVGSGCGIITPVCGNSIVEHPEQCDGQPGCNNSSCQWITGDCSLINFGIPSIILPNQTGTAYFNNPANIIFTSLDR